MATTKKQTEVKDEAVVNDEATIIEPKEGIWTTVKSKAAAGKDRVSRNKKKIAVAIGAGAAAVGLGIAYKLTGGLHCDEDGIECDGFGGSEDDAPFDDVVNEA